MKHSNIPNPDEIALAVKNVFVHAKETLGETILQALVPINRSFMPDHKTLPIHLEAEMDELCLFNQDFYPLATVQIAMEPDNNTKRLSMLRTRVQTLLYCHILEADYPYIVLLNLLRTMNNLPPCWTFYERNDDDTIKRNSENKILICDNPKKKIQHLKRLEESTPTSISACLNRLWSGDLRNAFSHSQYMIEASGNLIVTKYFSGVSGHTADQMKNHDVFFSVKEIQERFLTATQFLNTFIESYKTATTPFKSGAPFEIDPKTKVRWDSLRELWTFSQ